MDAVMQRDRRSAFLCGVEAALEYLRAAGYTTQAAFLAQTQWLHVAGYYYPDPTATRVREEPDPHLPDDIQWRVVDDVLECRVQDRGWVPFVDQVSTPTPARALLWADLYTHPALKVLV